MFGIYLSTGTVVDGDVGRVVREEVKMKDEKYGDDAGGIGI